MSSGHTFLITSGDTSINDISRNHDNAIGQRLSLSNSSASINMPVSAPRPSSSRSIIVYLYKGIEEKITNLNYTAEELCKFLLRKHFPKIGPAALNLFALAVIDPKRNDKCVWKSPVTDMKDLQQHLYKSSTAKLYLRIRYLPVSDKIELLQEVGDDVILYLYYQCKEDFVNDRLKVVFGSRKSLTSAKSRGLAVLDLLITGRDQGKDIKTIIDKMKLKQVLPPGELPAFWKLFTNWILKKKMKSHLTKFDESYPKESTRLEDLMLGYVKDILKEVMEYSIEQYEATTHSADRTTSKTVQIVIDVHNQPTGIRIDGDFFCKIEDLSCVSSSPSFENSKIVWRVHLDRANGFPGVFEFEDEDIADSFMSGLDGYYRLLKDYYFSLCKKMEPTSLKNLKLIRSFGPVKTDYAVEKLKKKTDDQEYYLYHQDMLLFDMFIVVYCKNGQARTEKMKVKNGNYFLESTPEHQCNDPGKLIAFHGERDRILPSNLTRLRPSNGEACGVLQHLFIDKSSAADDSADDSYSGKKNDPIVFRSQDLKLKEILDSGHFTEVVKAVLKVNKEEKVVAAKSLRTKKVKDMQIYRSMKAFQDLTTRLMAFNDQKFFVWIYGISMTFPMTLIVELAPLGSLSRFFRTRQTHQPIYLYHLLFTADQVSQGLFFLEENNLYHGNICCNNILVFKYEVNELSVKLADPGMTQLYEDLDLTHNVNVRRIPWLAPELCSTAKNKIAKEKASIKSDVYALGATMLEMFSQGSNPIDSPRFTNKDPEQIVRFFKEGKRSELPLPDDLVTAGEGEKLGQHVEVTETRDENSDTTEEETVERSNNYSNKSGAVRCKEELKTLIRKCLMFKPEDRPSFKEIVRDLYTLEYSCNYHTYEMPDDYNLPTSEPMFSSSDANDPAQSTMETVPDLIGSLHSDGSQNIITTIMPERERERASAPVPEIKSAVGDGNLPLLSLNKTKKEMDSILKSLPSRALPPKPEENNPLEHFKHLIDSKKLDFSENKKLGQGHYGEVKKGKLVFGPKRQIIVIAAKCLKGEFRSVLDDREFRQEATIMAKLEHKNIVKFYGISDEKIIMEFVESGAMSVYLRQKRKENNLLGSKQLVMIIRDVAMGMQHLADKRIIHSDLAGRNVLLTADLVAKIADFGLARCLQMDKDYYKRSRDKELPACWCAPEGLSHQRFTTKGDVWSYGVVVWEAFTHGLRPYADKKFNFKADGFNMKGRRLDLPENCPQQIKDMVLKCWEFHPDNRPGFDNLERICSDFLQNFEENETTSSNTTTVVSSPQTVPVQTVPSQSVPVQTVPPPSVPLPTVPLQSVPVQTVPSLSVPVQTVPSPSVPLQTVPSHSVLLQTIPLPSVPLQTVPLPSVPVQTIPSPSVPVQTVSSQSVPVQTVPLPTVPSPTVPLQVGTSPQPSNGQVAKGSQSAISGAIRHIANQGSCIVNAAMIPLPQSNPLIPLQTFINETNNIAVELRQSPEGTSAGGNRKLPDLPDLTYIIKSNEISDSSKLLGKGAFGVVSKATYKGREVALKKLNNEHNKETAALEEFREESKILKELDHPNIVKFVGFCQETSTIVMEFVRKGSLKDYLTQYVEDNGSLVQPTVLMKLITDVAKGMTFLSDKRILHCDLKCDNVLLTEDHVAKISDFGLSKMLSANKDYYRRQANKRVWLWSAAPECLQYLKFSSKSDVWSFGILMWQIFMHGKPPEFENVQFSVPSQLSAIIKDGKRLDKPVNCDDEAYNLMHSCWALEPELRINFQEIQEQCLSLLDKHKSCYQEMDHCESG